MKKVLILTVLLAMLLSAAIVQAQDPVELVIGSWRTEDIEAWDNIIAAYAEVNPDVELSFEPTLNVEYDGVLETALESGTGPDIITCRPFDRSLNLFLRGFMTDISDLDGLENFGDVARSGWISDDGEIYCVPVASVIHGFIYNVDMFNENGWEVPETRDQFMSLLQSIKDEGITPLAISTEHGWTTLTMGFDSNGPNFWNGEEGRQALISGEAQLTDPEFIAAFEFVVSWEPFMPEGHEAITYAETQQLFPLGRAAIFPAGSWEIPIFEANADFEMGAFKPPVGEVGDTCYINDHVDLGIGMNAATEHPEEAMEFLQWLTTSEFAQIYTDNQAGFFSLSDHEVDVSDPLAAAFVGWRQECETTIRHANQFLSRGEISPRDEGWRLFPEMVNGNMSVEEVAAELQSYLSVPGDS